MSSRVRDMLEAILQRARITPSEREAFEDIWDKYHRYGRLTSKQQAWAERVYFGQKLDRAINNTPTPPPPSNGFRKSKTAESAVRHRYTSKAARQSRVAYINHPGTTTTLMVTNLDMLKTICPDIKSGSKQYRKIESFFRGGGEVLKIKPVEDQPSMQTG